MTIEILKELLQLEEILANQKQILDWLDYSNHEKDESLVDYAALIDNNYRVKYLIKRSNIIEDIPFEQCILDYSEINLTITDAESLLMDFSTY